MTELRPSKIREVAHLQGGFALLRNALRTFAQYVPLDVVRELESEGRIGALHDSFYTTSGVDTPVATAVKFGQEIAAELRSAEVSAVILTGT